jgi:nucleoside-diphosphate-sugar epimerase
MQTILGSGGAIGTDLAKALKQFTDEIKLVSRNPVKVNDTDILFSADFADPSQISKAIEGSEICYITVGFEYNIKVWQQKWPEFIRNTVSACVQHQTKLVFFDNVYAIGGDNVKHITENSPISPTSKKGEVRAWIDRYILEEVEKGKLDAIIARAPDFFGPVKKQNSLLMNLVYDNMAKGKTAQWFGNPDAIHTMGYTPDLAKGTAILGNCADAYNQIWNLPVDMNSLTGRELVKLFANEMNASDKIQAIPNWMIRILGVFIPFLREMPEMMYQFDRDFNFDSTKFINKFGFVPTPNKEAVAETIQALRIVTPQ